MMVVARYPRRPAFFAMVELRDPPRVKVGANDHSHSKRCFSAVLHYNARGREDRATEVSLFAREHTIGGIFRAVGFPVLALAGFLISSVGVGAAEDVLAQRQTALRRRFRRVGAAAHCQLRSDGAERCERDEHVERRGQRRPRLGGLAQPGSAALAAPGLRGAAREYRESREFQEH